MPLAKKMHFLTNFFSDAKFIQIIIHLLLMMPHLSKCSNVDCKPEFLTFFANLLDISFYYFNECN